MSMHKSIINVTCAINLFDHKILVTQRIEKLNYLEMRISWR